MDIQDFATGQDAYDYMKGHVSYVMESMFFNPRRDNVQYAVQPHDLLMVKTENDTFRWIPAENFGSLVVGVEFKDVVEEFEAIKTVAVPKVYNFSAEDIHALKAYFNWSALGVGFGQMSFGLNEETGVVEFDTEMFGREKTRHMLHQFVDFIVDNGVSDDWRPLA